MNWHKNESCGELFCVTIVGCKQVDLPRLIVYKTFFLKKRD
jgi:hypothetical protein